MGPIQYCEEIYNRYPRKIGKRDALRSIEKALQRLVIGEAIGEMNFKEAKNFLLSRVEMYAKSDAGNRGNFTPYPATWFNRSSYLDDEREWNKNGREPSKVEARTQRNREAILAGLGISADAGSVGADNTAGSPARRGPILAGDVQD